MSITREDVTQAISLFLESSPRPMFSTVDIARFMNEPEYSVRAFVTWLVREDVIELVPGVRTTRYTGTRGQEYGVSMYRMKEHGADPDFAVLMGAFCRA